MVQVEQDYDDKIKVGLGVIETIVLIRLQVELCFLGFFNFFFNFLV